MLYIKNLKKLRSAVVKTQYFHSLCFRGFTEKAIWGEENLISELVRYENWLKEL